MAQVPEKVLGWLYEVLHDYSDTRRTYSDVVRTLSSYPTLNPRTEVYSYDNGHPALLLTLGNTLPVNYRGTVYRFPVQVWLPKTYPQEPPMVYVKPGQDMMIRPGQHVGVDGRVYHPYLADWGRMSDRASIAEFLGYLQQAFAKEPPVISRAQQQQYQRPIGRSQAQQQAGASPVPPQLPPKQVSGTAGPVAMSNGGTPPPLPLKPGEVPSAYPARTSSRSISDSGPPLPPLPQDRPYIDSQIRSTPYQNGFDDRPSSQGVPVQGLNTRFGQPSGPPLPPLPGQARQQYTNGQRPAYERSPVSPLSPVNGYSELPESKYSRSQPLPPHQRQHQQMPAQYAQAQPQRVQQIQQLPQQQAHYNIQPQQPHHPQQPYPQQFVQHPQPQPPKQPPPDLLSDPFDIALPGPSPGTLAPAPPIPPNPEKEHLLYLVSTALVQQAQQKVNQNLSAVVPLQAQQQALRAAQDRLEAEIRQLDQLDQTLASNEAMLRRSIQECDRTIATAKSKPPPPVDEVLIAPTMVANQLWTLCAEEAACREAMYVLQRAVDRGRVSGHDFVRQMRSLGRECFLKMVLARKCARGMGLEVKGR